MVCKFDLLDRVGNSELELKFGLDPVSNSLPEFAETGRVNEQKVAFERLRVQLDCAVDINFNDRNLAGVFNARKLLVTCAIATALKSLLVLNELVGGDHLAEFVLADVFETVLPFLHFAGRPSGVRDFAFEQIPVLLNHRLNQHVFANPRWPYHDEGLVLQRCGVERVEVLLGVDEDIILEE